jgi:hypothetical protein
MWTESATCCFTNSFLTQTAIFDSCHAGGMGRKPLPRSEFTARTIPPSEDILIPLTLDIDIWQTVSILSELRHEDQPSHVLLAACGREQFAYERGTGVNVRGVFTSSLVRKLQTVDIGRITYVELVNSLTMSPLVQLPLCEGVNKDRLLFKDVSRKENTFALVEKGEHFEVQIGSLSGVCVHTEFSLRHPYSGILRTVSCTTTSSTLETKPGAQKPLEGARVKVSKWNNDQINLKIFAPKLSDTIAKALFPNSPETATPSDQLFIMVDCRMKANIELNYVADTRYQFIIERLDETILSHDDIDAKIEFTVDELSRLPDVFNGIAHFNYYLQLHDSKSPLRVRQEFAMELHLVDGPRGFRVRKEFENLLPEDKVTLEEDEKAKYGITIYNYSQYDLYPYLFCFDPARYVIEVWSPVSFLLRGN